MAINRILVKSAMVGALGGLLFGFDTAVIAGSTCSLIKTFLLSPSGLGLTVSIALWGTVIGALSAGELGEQIGGRGALRVMAMMYLISSLGCAFAWNWPTLLAFRFIGGLGIGGSSVLGPVYISEIAPARWRGRLIDLEAPEKLDARTVRVFVQFVSLATLGRHEANRPADDGVAGIL